MKPIGKSRGNALPNVLAISLDSNLALGTEARLGDSTRRVLAVASVCQTYHIVMRTFRPGSRSIIPLGDNCFLYPANSRNRMSFIGDAITIGSRIIRSNPIDVLYTQDPFSSGLAGYALKRRFRKPLALSFAGDMIDNPHWCGESPRNRVMNRFGKWLIRRADAFRVCSTSERAKLIARGVPAGRIHNIGWLSDFSRFENADGKRLRERFLSNGFDRLLLFVGRLVKQKNLPNLIAAMKIVTEAQGSVLLLVVGDGEESARVKELARRLRVEKNVLFLGAVEHERLPDYFAACDAFVLPSFYEGNAIAVMEAAAAGRPSVSTDVSGASDTIIDGVTGFIVENNNPVRLAERLIALLNDPAKARDMGRSARSRVTRKYAEETILKQFREMFMQAKESNASYEREPSSILLSARGR